MFTSSKLTLILKYRAWLYICFLFAVDVRQYCAFHRNIGLASILLLYSITARLSQAIWTRHAWSPLVDCQDDLMECIQKMVFCIAPGKHQRNVIYDHPGIQKLPFRKIGAGLTQDEQFWHLRDLVNNPLGKLSPTNLHLLSFALPSYCI